MISPNLEKEIGKQSQVTLKEDEINYKIDFNTVGEAIKQEFVEYGNKEITSLFSPFSYGSSCDNNTDEIISGQIF